MEETHYYPFGLVMAGISSKAAGIIQNKEKTFQGQRFDDVLGLNLVQFKWRNHDPQIGRFIEIDPLSDKYVYNSTYAFSENKVTRHIELEGLEAVLPNPTGSPVIAFYNTIAGWGQDLHQGAESYVNSRVEQANLQAGNYDNQPSVAQDFHKTNAALGETAGVMQMNKPALEIVSTVASTMVGLEIPASAPLVTVTSSGLRTTISLSENAVSLGGFNSIVKQTSAETLSPNVQKVINMMGEIKSLGGTITSNSLSPNQELNLTIKSIQKMDFRIETHVVPTKFGGNGVTPQRHMNVDLYPNKEVLPNSGHKIIE